MDCKKTTISYLYWKRHIFLTVIEQRLCHALQLSQWFLTFSSSKGVVNCSPLSHECHTLPTSDWKDALSRTWLKFIAAQIKGKILQRLNVLMWWFFAAKICLLLTIGVPTITSLRIETRKVLCSYLSAGYKITGCLKKTFFHRTHKKNVYLQTLGQAHSHPKHKKKELQTGKLQQ